MFKRSSEERICRRYPRILIVTLILSTLIGTVFLPQGLVANAASPTTNDAPDYVPTGMKLVWGDDFNGTSGALPDTKRWGAEVGKHGAQFGQLEYSTPLPNICNGKKYAPNAFLDGESHLVIEADKGNGYPCLHGRRYTSSFLVSKKAYDFKYGYVAARIKIPHGQGMWPAFWALTDSGQEGEFDIMENVGKAPGTIESHLHGPGIDPGKAYTLSGGKHFSDNYHVFAMNWKSSSITFSMDGHQFYTYTRAQAGRHWVFNHPIYLILNIAVGGDWPGKPNSSTPFPARMLVDYVHVYKA